MPQLEWNDTDFLDFFAVEPTPEDYDVSHSYDIERNGLRLLFTVWQYESVIQVSVFRGDSDDALFTFAAYVRSGLDSSTTNGGDISKLRTASSRRIGFGTLNRAIHLTGNGSQSRSP